jgi:O-antigen ligase
MSEQVWRVLLAVAIVAAGAVGARLISRWTGWRHAGPIALLVGAPLVPHLAIASRLSTDDLLPLLGLGILIVSVPPPRLTRSTLLRAGLAAVAVATAARIASTVVHEPTFIDATLTLTAALVRPLFLVAAAVYVAVVVRRTDHRRLVAAAMGVLGTVEAVFSLAMFMIPVPGVGVRQGLSYETLAGCDLRITGTLGLSANHIGAVFVVTIPMAIGMAMSSSGRRQVLWTLAAALQATALILTFTRASILVGGLASILLLLYLMRFRMAAVMAVATFVVLSGVTAIACAPQQGIVTPPGVTPTPTPTQPDIVPGPIGEDGVIDRFGDPSDRPALWYAAGLMTLDYPLFGVGIGNMVDVMRSDPERYVETPYGRATNSAHNTILLAGAETGILGALSTFVINAVIALVALQTIVFRRRHTIAVAASFAALAFLAQGMVNNLFTVPATGTLLAVLVALMAATANAEAESRHGPA